MDLFLFMGQSNMAGRGTVNNIWEEPAPVIIPGAGYEFRAITDPAKLYDMVEPFGVKENRIQEDIMYCEVYNINTLENYKFVVVLSEYNGKIMLSRHKGRTTWETQGGHIEAGETPLETAKRELYEESGALEFDISPLCDYRAGSLENGIRDEDNGMVFTAHIRKLGTMPESEMEEVCTFDALPDNLTYPQITPVLFAKKEENQILSSIPGFEDWEQITRLDKGFSDDRKYLLVTRDHEKLLLRISDISMYDNKKKEYDIIQKYSKIGFEMSMPMDFGICSEGKKVYMLLSWVEGEDLEIALPGLSEEEQYLLGRSAGKILKNIHSIPVDRADIPQKTKQEKKLKQLERYENSSVRIKGDETALQYVKDNLDKTWSLDPVYMHGDYHPGNLIFTPARKVGVIDFNRWEVGDPYEEFYKLESFGIEVSIPYCIGQIDAYFDDRIPDSFWQILAVYVAHASLYSIKWAERFGQDNIDGMIRRCQQSFRNFDNFRQTKPIWYDASLKEKYHDGDSEED